MLAVTVAVCMSVQASPVGAMADSSDTGSGPGAVSTPSSAPEPEPQPEPEYLLPPAPIPTDEPFPYVPIPPLVADFSYLERRVTGASPSHGTGAPIRSGSSQSNSGGAATAAEEVALARAIILRQIAESVTRVCDSIAFLRVPAQPPKNAS